METKATEKYKKNLSQRKSPTRVCQRFFEVRFQTSFPGIFLDGQYSVYTTLADYTVRCWCRFLTITKQNSTNFEEKLHNKKRSSAIRQNIR